MVEAQPLLVLSLFHLGRQRGALPAAQSLVSLEPQSGGQPVAAGRYLLACSNGKTQPTPTRRRAGAGDDASTHGAGMIRLQLGQMDAGGRSVPGRAGGRSGRWAGLAGLGGVNAQQGPTGRSGQCFRAVAGCGRQRSPCRQLASVYQQQGEIDNAIAQYEQAVALDNSQPLAGTAGRAVCQHARAAG